MKTYTLKKTTDLHVITPHRFQIDYKKELNPSQYEAVTSVNGPHLIIAGAGTGKTRTIVYRAAYLIELGVNPQHVLLLTFTRKAAQEMLRRASILLDERCERIKGGTFHAYANSVLRKHAALIGFDTNFTILDQRDAEDVVNLVRTRLKLDSKPRRFPKKETLYDLYSRSVNMMQPLSVLLANDYPHYAEVEEDIAKVCNGYIQYKQAHNLMDYDDLLIYLLKLLTGHEGVREKLSDQCKYIMVDEYQDTNKLQAEISMLLAVKYRNLMVVGDDAQAIYAFRGATIRNILDFPEQMKGCKIIKLEENYRSTQPILNVANAILQAGSHEEIEEDSEN